MNNMLPPGRMVFFITATRRNEKNDFSLLQSSEAQAESSKRARDKYFLSLAQTCIPHGFEPFSGCVRFEPDEPFF